MSEKKQRNGLIQVYTGSSEHLDYAPVGLALRAAGQDLKTHMTCFLPYPLSEGLPRAAVLLSPHLTLAQTAPKENDPRKWARQDRQDMQDAFQSSRNALISGKFDIVVLAGILSLMGPDLIPPERVMGLVRERPGHVELVLTGTGPPEQLIDAAHLVTDVAYRKGHPKAQDERAGSAPTEVITGNGKGKTTYCLGKALLMSCIPVPGMILQFIKSSRPYGEVKAIGRLPDLDIRTMGMGFLDESADVQEMKHQDAARQAWEGCLREIFSLKYGVVVLDEINIATHYGLVHPERARELMFLKPHRLHLILSGRNAHPEVMEGAATIIEMREVKHPYQQGIKARKGIEF